MVGAFGVALWQVILDAGFPLLLGFFFAGLVSWLIPSAVLLRWLGGRGFWPVLRAAAIGAPLPMCSCSVLPTALTLHRQGASRATTASFLVSTPETDITTLSLTWALFGWPIALYRVTSAIVAAVVAGLLVGWGDRDDAPVAVPASTCTTHDQCCEPSPNDDHAGHTHAEASPIPKADAKAEEGWWPGFVRGQKFAFGELLAETSWWLLFGLVLSALIAVAAPPDLIGALLGPGLLGKLMAFVIAAPMYVCASAATPIAASLVAQGMSPGTALVFLIAGPTVSVGPLTIQAKVFGWRFVQLQLLGLGLTVITSGLLLDALILSGAMSVVRGSGVTGTSEPGLLEVVAGFALVALLVLRASEVAPPNELASPVRWLGHVTGLTTAWRRAFAGALLVVGLLTSQCLAIVSPSQMAIRVTLGQVEAEPLGPGVHWQLPPPLGRLLRSEPGTLRQVELGFRTNDSGTSNRLPSESLSLTGDENLIDVSATAHYRLTDPRVVVGSLRQDQIEGLVRASVLAALWRAIGSRGIDSVYTTARAAIEAESLAAASEVLSKMVPGLKLRAVSLLDVHAPSDVHAAFREVASSMEDQARYSNEAQAQALQTLAQAQTDRTKRLARAEGDRAAMLGQAQAEAASSRSKIAALREGGTVARERAYLMAIEQQLAGHALMLRRRSTGLTWDLWRSGPARNAANVPGVVQPQADQTTAPDERMSIQQYFQQRRQQASESAP